jgi:hypothetical protein
MGRLTFTNLVLGSAAKVQDFDPKFAKNVSGFGNGRRTWGGKVLQLKIKPQRSVLAFPKGMIGKHLFQGAWSCSSDSTYSSGTCRPAWMARRFSSILGQPSKPANCPRSRARAASPRQARSASRLICH